MESSMVEADMEYYSFLLRMWRVKDENGDSWRCSLENVMTGEKHGFTCLKEMLLFITKLGACKEETAV